MVDLSPGQECLREIVAEHYPAYKKHMEEVGYYNSKSNSYCEPIRESLKNDPIITQDYITGQHFDDFKVSGNYLDWQVEKTGEKWDDWRCEGKTPASIRLDKFYLVMNGHFYEGHRKYDSTYSCLMGLHEGKQLTRMESVTYFVQEGVLKPGGDGHHRTLAHVLYGEPVINTRFHYMVETKPDPILNRCLLKLEKFFKEISETPEFIHSDKHHIRRSRIRFETSIYGSEKEMEDIRTFCRDTPDEEWDLIRRVMLHCITNKLYIKHPFIFGNSVSISDLVKFSNAIREVKGLLPLNTLCLKIKNRLPAWRDEVSQLERLLLGLRDFEDEALQKRYKSFEYKN